MIIDSLENAQLYENLNNNFKNVFNFIKNNDLSLFPLGKNEGDETFYFIVNEYDTKLEFHNILEAHKKYIDLQYVLSGNEIIRFETYKNQQENKCYNADDDYVLYTSETAMNIKLNEGLFAIFFPNDLHMPGFCCESVSKLKKIVFKIKIN